MLIGSHSAMAFVALWFWSWASCLTENFIRTGQRGLWCGGGSSVGQLGVQMDEAVSVFGYPFWLFFSYFPILWSFLGWRPPEMGIALYSQLVQSPLYPFLHKVEDHFLSPKNHLISVRTIFVGKDIKYPLVVQSYCIQWHTSDV